MHLWEAHRPDRPWTPEEADKPIFIAAPGARPHREQPLSATEMIATMDGAGVDRVIIVPPSPVGDDNLTATEAVRDYPNRFAIMGRFDPTSDGARDRLQTWLHQPNMLGIRMTFHKPKWSGWLTDHSIDWFWEDCQRLCIPLMMLVPGRLPDVARIASRYPNLTIIVDHMGLKSALRDAAAFSDLDVLLSCAKRPNVYVKASSAPCYSTETFPFANLQLPLERIFNAFGAERTFWGSDYTRLPCSYRECIDHFLSTLPFLKGRDLELVMGEAISNLLRWPHDAAH